MIKDFKFDLQNHGGVTKFIGKLFGAKQVDNSATTALTGRDILPSTTSNAPESAIMGSSEDELLPTGKDTVKINLNTHANKIKESYKSKLYA